MTIDMKKQYRTRDGEPVRLFEILSDTYGQNRLFGAVCQDGRWRPMWWCDDGKANYARALDLIEVRPRIKREIWVNVYPTGSGVSAYNNKLDADHAAFRDRIACVKLVIDCEEGEGL